MNVISSLLLEEKVGQLFHIGIRGKKFSPKIQYTIQKYKVGGIILFAHNLGKKENIRRLNTALQESSRQSSGIPLLISTDQEGGRVKRLGPEIVVNFPGAMAFGQAAKESYTQEAAFITGYELRTLGINWVLAPVLDVNNNPQNPVINVRSFGSNSKLAGRMGRAYILGNRRALSLSAVKHFPGHGDTDVDSHFTLPLIDKTIEEMEAAELLPFQEAIQKAKAEVVMTAHILFPSLDSEHPATLSPRILKELLREKLGFQGVITTDAMEMQAIAKRYKPEEAARLAFQAGVDIILLTKEGSTLKKMYRALLQDFQKKRLSMKSLDRALARQINLKMKRGLFHRWKSPYTNQTGRKQKDVLQKHWEYQEKKVENRYQIMQRKYKKRGADINTLISRDAVTSLRQAFSGLSLKDFPKARLLVKSKAMRKEALQMGIPQKHIHKLQSGRSILQIENQSSQTIWLIEVTAKSLRQWNKLVERQKEAFVQGRRFPSQITALYTGNPFLKIMIPKQGAVLASYSDTAVSQAALVYRALYPQKPIKQADLILP